MYGLKYVKGMVLAPVNKTTEMLLLTLKNQSPGINHIQCLSMMKIGQKHSSDNTPDLFYSDKSGAIIFYNELDNSFYNVNCTGFSFVDIENAKLEPVFFIDEELLNKIIGVFVAKYYGLESDGDLILSDAIRLISEGFDVKIEKVQNEDEELYNPYIEDEFVYRSMMNDDSCDTSLYSQFLNELSQEIHTLQSDDKNNNYIIDVFLEEEDLSKKLVYLLNNQPKNEKREDLYKALNLTPSLFRGIRKAIIDTYPDLVIEPRK